jgi:hypothetical protein
MPLETATETAVEPQGGPTVHGYASVQFVEIPAANAAARQAWCRYRGDVESETTNQGWRLIAANNREIGRGAQLFTSCDQARAAVHRLQQEYAFELQTFHGPRAGTHGWSAAVGGRLVITCARWYETETISREAAGTALTILRDARIH